MLNLLFSLNKLINVSVVTVSA